MTVNGKYNPNLKQKTQSNSMSNHKKISNQSEYCRNLIQTDPSLSGITFDKKPRTYDFIPEIMKRLLAVSE